MKINEYQAKAILSKHSILVPQGKVVTTPDEALNVFLELKRKPCVIKAQILTGGRGKSGGIKIAGTEEEVKTAASNILGSTIVTHQTGSTGIRVCKILIEEAISIAKEFYLAFAVDHSSESLVLIVSAEGGVEIEEIAIKTPEKIIKEKVDPRFGIHEFQLRRIATRLGLHKTLFHDFSNLTRNLFNIFVDKDCSLLEINPLALTKEGKLCALDVKIDVDDNALFRQNDIAKTKEFEEHESIEAKASKYGLSYINLDGSIGCMVNGAGLAMATMDIIKLHGMAPANFLDVGGDAHVEKVKQAFELILSDKKVKGVLVNIFGGIMKCDVIAKGIVQAVNDVDIHVPLVVRLEGTNENEAKRIIKDSGLDIISANTMQETAEKIIQAVNR
ncbi:MAG: ADP-forming succinate--CoA ligase subunit beta [Candidatus Anammoxibacter sp.]